MSVNVKENEEKHEQGKQEKLVNSLGITVTPAAPAPAEPVIQSSVF